MVLLVPSSRLLLVRLMRLGRQVVVLVVHDDTVVVVVAVGIGLLHFKLLLGR